MTVKDCLGRAATSGEITPEERDALTEMFDGLLKHFGDPNKAKAEMVTRLMNKAAHMKRQAEIADEKRRQREDDVLAARDARGQIDPAKGLVAIHEHNGQVQMPKGFSSMVGREKAITALAMARMETVLHEFRRTWVKGTTRNLARLENVVRELFGESTGDDAAAGLAKAWSDVAESLRLRFNAAGGAIGKLELWGLPQSHNVKALLAAGRETWINTITPLLDPAKMLHPLTGLPMTAKDLRQSLEHIWTTITTDGWNEREVTSRIQGLGSISNRRADQRFLIFKDANSWLAYQRDFGGGDDPFAAMMNHIRGMAKDIAAMEVLGPNPRAMLTYLQNFVRQQAALKAAKDPEAKYFPDVAEYTGRRMEEGGSWFTTKSPIDYANSQIRLSEDMWTMWRGGEVVNSRVADTFATFRQWNVATKLGSTALSALSDLGYQMMARSFAGLPVMKVFSSTLRSFATGPKRDAVRAALILDSAIHVLHREARWAGSMQGPMWSAYLADRVLAATALQAFTQAGRHGFGMDFMGTLASLADKPFAELPKKIQRDFRRYGLDASDWETIRPLGLDKEFLTATDVSDAMAGAGREKEHIAERYLEMILQETEYAVPTGNLQAQARSYGGLRHGVVIDEMRRSMGQFKMFGISVALLQGQRIAAEMIQNGMWRGGGYAAALLIVTSLYGALSAQLRDVAQGKDPQPMDDAKFWGRALLQGGGLGIFGDFLASETSRNGGGFMRTLAGPPGDFFASVLSLTSGNVAQAIRGEKTNFGREVMRFIKANTPGGSAWYLRLAYERLVLDQLQRMADPEAHQAFRRQMQRQQRDFKSDFWWAPGDTEPKRGPRLENALE